MLQVADDEMVSWRKRPAHDLGCSAGGGARLSSCSFSGGLFENLQDHRGEVPAGVLTKARVDEVAHGKISARCTRRRTVVHTRSVRHHPRENICIQGCSSGPFIFTT